MREVERLLRGVLFLLNRDGKIGGIHLGDFERFTRDGGVQVLRGGRDAVQHVEVRGGVRLLGVTRGAE